MVFGQGGTISRQPAASSIARTRVLRLVGGRGGLGATPGGSVSSGVVVVAVTTPDPVPCFACAVSGALWTKQAASRSRHVTGPQHPGARDRPRRPDGAGDPGTPTTQGSARDQRRIWSRPRGGLRAPPRRWRTRARPAADARGRARRAPGLRLRPRRRGDQGLLPRHGPGPPDRHRGDRPAASGRARHLGSACSARRPRRSAPAARCATRTSSSRPTASTASPGAAASTRCTCSACSAASTRAAGTRAPTTSTSTRSSSAPRPCTRPATRWACSATARSAPATPTATPPSSRTSATAPRSQGDVNEAFIWASVFNAPVVFFCQNNQWAISEPIERQTRIPLYQRAAGLRLPRRARRRQRRPRDVRRHPGGAAAGPRGQRPDLRRGLHLPDGRAHDVRRPDEVPAQRGPRALEAQGPDRARQGLPVPQRRRRRRLLRRGRAPRPTSSPPHLREGCLAMPDPSSLDIFDHVTSRRHAGAGRPAGPVRRVPRFVRRRGAER